MAVTVAVAARRVEHHLELADDRRHRVELDRRAGDALVKQLEVEDSFAVRAEQSNDRSRQLLCQPRQHLTFTEKCRMQAGEVVADDEIAPLSAGELCEPAEVADGM